MNMPGWAGMVVMGHVYALQLVSITVFIGVFTSFAVIFVASFGLLYRKGCVPRKEKQQQVSTERHVEEDHPATSLLQEVDMESEVNILKRKEPKDDARTNEAHSDELTD